MDINLLSQLVSEGLSQRGIAERLSCSQTNVKYWLTKYGLKTKKSTRKAKKNCRNCGIVLVNRQKIVCSPECHVEYQSKSKVQAWLNGEWDGTRGKKHKSISEWIRNFLLEEAEYKCSQCSWSEVNPVTGNHPLQIDHIDGDYENNSRDNLRVLCPNCHSLTPTYGSLNTGNGRPYYKEVHR